MYLETKSAVLFVVEVRDEETGFWEEKESFPYTFKEETRELKCFWIKKIVKCYDNEDKGWIDERIAAIRYARLNKLAYPSIDIRVKQKDHWFISEDSVNPLGHYYWAGNKTIWENGKFAD